MDEAFADHLPSYNFKNRLTIAESKIPNYKALKEKLDNYHWQELFDCNNVNEFFDAFIKNFKIIISQTSKVLKINAIETKKQRFKKPWMQITCLN